MHGCRGVFLFILLTTGSGALAQSVNSIASAIDSARSDLSRAVVRCRGLASEQHNRAKKEGKSTEASGTAKSTLKQGEQHGGVLRNRAPD